MLWALLAPARQAAAQAAQAALAFSLGVAFVLAFAFDLGFAQGRRNLTLMSNEMFAGIEAPAVLWGPPEFLARRIGEPGRLIAFQEWRGGVPDATLVGGALDRGYKVFIFEPQAQQLLDTSPGFRRTGTVYGEGIFLMSEIARDGG